MGQPLNKGKIIEVLLNTFQEIQQSCDGEKEVTVSSSPGNEFDYIDSQILLQVTGLVAAELGIEIPKKFQLFVGQNLQKLTVEQAADKLLQLTEPNGSR